MALRELKSILAFLLIFAGLQWLYGLGRGTAIERLLIDMLTVRPSVALINLITPGENVRAVGHSLVSPHDRLNVLNGCEGIETFFLLLAAILIHRTSWRHKLSGAALGVVFVHGLNQARIVTLFYAFRYDKSLFSLLHGYMLPVVLILLTSLFFLAWAVACKKASNGSTPHA
ncbi:archaeosortase/exosortase family protein [Methylocaldum gracile]|jgi:exosortase family protein XrtM|uniref:archaeosortase/exosortase family protein n=1 Tax=unclassified Methylocaldum TaxID=2622260 RepID=UPI00105C254F